jgi:hypothetical protein
MKEYFPQEQIEAYLRNELGEAEKQEFEQLLRRDPLLQNEFLLQKDVISSLQVYRKNQLKDRLNRIDVKGPGSDPFASIKTAGIWLSGILILGFTGLFIYDNTFTSSQQVTSSEHIKAPSSPAATPIAPQPENQVMANTKESPGLQTEASPVSKERTKAAAASKTSSKKFTNSISTIHPVAPASDHIDKHFQEESLKKEETVSAPSGKIASSEENHKNRLNIVDNSTTRFKHHFYYHNGQIALLGFEKPYELLDIHSEDAMFLYYEGHFYKLQYAQLRPTPIKDVEVTDAKTIEMLQEWLKEKE